MNSDDNVISFPSRCGDRDANPKRPAKGIEILDSDARFNRACVMSICV